MTNKELSYAGEIGHFPEEVVEWMLQQQEIQGNKRSVSVFEFFKCSARNWGGFDWQDTFLGLDTCRGIIYEGNFRLFFENFPRQQKPAEPKEYKIPDNTRDLFTWFPGPIIPKGSEFKTDDKYTRIVIEMDGVSHGITDYGLIMTTDRFAAMLNDILVSSTSFDKATLFNAVIDELEASLEILEN